MNETSVNTTFLGIGLAVMGGTLVSLRREHIRTEYSVSWLVVGLTMTLFALFPGLIGRFAVVIGDLRICFLIIGGTLISGLVFELSHVVSKLRDENVLLAQRLAILEYYLERKMPNVESESSG